MQKFIKNIMKNRPRYYAGLILLALICFVGILQLTPTKRSSVDWMNQSDWSHFTGAEKTDYGIQIFPTGRMINHSDTSTAQPNPPVNIRGSYLEVPSDFEINLELTGIDNEATVQFYGQIPNIYDEWRQERPSIRLEAKNDGLYVRIWDGTASNSIDERIYKLGLKNKIRLSLVHKNESFVIKINGRAVGTIPDHKIFSNGTVWFGADTKLGTEGWVLNSLTAKGLAEADVKLVNSLSLTGIRNDPNTLRNLSQNNSRKLPIGFAVAIGPLLTDKQYNSIALSQFSMMTPENSFKPQFVHPEKDLYLFQDTDTLVEAAQNNKMTVHGHALVMGKATPEWMQKTPINERKKVMVDHINTVVGRYKGKIAQWDVVNEPMSEDAIDYKDGRLGLRKHMWSDAMGDAYIDIAYKAARAADKDAKLFLNDFGLEKDGERWDAFLKLVQRLRSRGVPIDGVGFESHIYHSPADNIDPVVLSRHIQSLAAMGIESRISEIDVLGDDPVLQAKQYADALQVCLSEPTCTSYSTWGITDLYGSTTLSERYPVKLGDSLLWDASHKPKPALKSLQTILSQP